MLSEEEKKAIEIFTDLINYLEKWNKNLTVVPDDKKYYETVLKLITKLQKEKRENQKTELAILNEKQKEMNKLKNTVKSYKGQFKRQEKEIKKLQKENEEKDKTIEKYIKIYKEYDCYRWVKELEKKDKQIDLMAGYIENIDTDEDICKEQADNNCDDINREADCKDCIKQYFKKLSKEKGE